MRKQLLPRPAPVPTPSTAPVARRLAWAGSALAAALLAAAIVWLALPPLWPIPSTPLEAMLHGMAVDAPRAPASLLAALSATMLAVGIAALRGRAIGVGAPVLALVASVAMMFALLGLEALIVSGYSFAFVVPLAVVALVVALAPRRPVAAILMSAAVAAILVAAALLGLPLDGIYGWFGAMLVGSPLRFIATLALTALAGVWLLWSALLLTRRLAGMGRFAARHRVAVTVAAAACAVPYSIARASWLTPWPLFGGSDELFAQDPKGQLVGVLLGGAILAGGVLTLGLILPWGSRVPRWVPFIAGRSIPVALAVVPASFVALLFTTAGIQLVVLALSADLLPTIAFVLPLWLWGPLLGLATWGYAIHRGEEQR